MGFGWNSAKLRFALQNGVGKGRGKGREREGEGEGEGEKGENDVG